MSDILTARKIALKALSEVEKKSVPVDVVLNRAVERYTLSPKDISFIFELVKGVTRNRLSLDWIADTFSRKPVVKADLWVRNILRLGIYQIVYLDRVPQSAAVNQSVELAKKFTNPATAGYVNAILRKVCYSLPFQRWPSMQKDLLLYLSIYYSHPQWMIERWLQRWSVEETQRLLETNNRSPHLCIRVNSLRCCPQSLKIRLKESGIVVNEGKFLPQSFYLSNYPAIREIPGFNEGLFMVQNESAMFVSYLLAPSPGEKIVDLCSAPGGKATHVAELMKDRGEIFAVDIKEDRLQMIEENCARLGITSIMPLLADARELVNILPQWADKVLIDAPCSSTGVLAKKVDARWRKKPEDIKQYSLLQRELLLSGERILKPGGTMVYSTCSLEPEENQEVVDYVIKTTKSMVVESPVEFLPLEARQKLLDKSGKFVQILPHHHDMDGFFIARLRKKR